MKLGPGQAPGYPTGKAVTVNDAYNAQMNLMVDMDDCKDAFKVFDPENTGTIIKDVTTCLNLFCQHSVSIQQKPKETKKIQFST